MRDDPFSSHIWPLTVKLLKQEKKLLVEFDDGSVFSLSAEYLRVETPSTDIGHSGGSTRRSIIPGCKNVRIRQIEPIGNYAIRILFDDNHNSGIYSWSYLHELGTKQDEKWHRYLQVLESLGLSRDPRKK